jgi:hypothetical protein
LVQIFIVSSLKVLFQDCYYTLQNDR